MIGIIATSLTTAAFEANADAICQYRAGRPILMGVNHRTRILHMLHSALHADWARNRAEGSWLTIEELTWGTSVTMHEVTEILLDLAFSPAIKLSRRMVDGAYGYSLENGMGR
jgi:hypothetical protein